MEDLPFRTLLYRYFFFNWLFKDTNASDMFERASALRHNRRQAASWLPVYMLRWLWWGLGCYAVASVIELLLESPGLASWIYAASAMCLGFAVTTLTTWLSLTQRREQH